MGLSHNVLDLVPLPHEARVSAEGESFPEHVRRIHDEVRASIKTNNDNYKQTANEHQRFKEFAKGDLVMVYLRKERYPKGTYHKLKSRKIGRKTLKKISSNAYVVEPQNDLQISHIFKVTDLFDFHGFTDDDQGRKLEDSLSNFQRSQKK
ncbi:hypothetical protein CFOL_v3_12819 [Cephalotus follicularis]|uniref:Tf2-1-like SH3-like domain-containing protein n=1 Tax=Cephalotus follicularis TaxID=3775 RepID=A0A1Q3BN27_CEPFO|nr:hypothetical protein CFOL_v3_12819 [Cephalotus follicularis]